MKDRKVKQVPSQGLYQWEGGEHKEGVKKVHMVEIQCVHVGKRISETC
jgi:hypothetical protein